MKYFSKLMIWFIGLGVVFVTSGLLCPWQWPGLLMVGTGMGFFNLGALAEIEFLQERKKQKESRCSPLFPPRQPSARKWMSKFSKQPTVKS